MPMIDSLLTLLVWALLLCVLAVVGCMFADGHLTRPLARLTWAWSARVLTNLGNMPGPLSPRQHEYGTRVMRLHLWASKTLDADA